MTKPFTYLIGWSEHSIFYYGVRYSRKNCHPDTLWTTYFTSSKYVKKFRSDWGEPDIIQIRRMFETREQAVSWEYRVLRRLGAAKRKDFLNRTQSQAVSASGYVFDREVVRKRNEKVSKTLMGHTDSLETRQAKSLGRLGMKFSDAHKMNISEARTGMKFSPSHKMNISEAQTGRKRGPYNNNKKTK